MIEDDGQGADIPGSVTEITQVVYDGTTYEPNNDGEIIIQTAYGILTVTASTGSYIYNLTNSIGVGETEVFTYTALNGTYSDTATLTINIADIPPVSLDARLAEDTGESGTDKITQNGLINVPGIEVGASWQYSVDGGNTWVNGTGTSFTLAEGEYESVELRQINAIGSIGPSFIMEDVKVDQSINLSLISGLDNIGPQQGNFFFSQVTDDSSPVIYGIGEPGATVSIYSTGVTNGNPGSISNPVGGTLDPDGKFTYFYNEENALAPGNHVIVATITDLAGNTKTDTFEFTVANDQVRPDVVATDGGLLGLVGGNVGGIISLDQQQFVVGDVNGDLRQVAITFSTTLGTGTRPTWLYSELLEQQFGYDVTVEQNWTGVGVYTGSMTITIRAQDNSNLDNQEIIEFLGTVRSSQSLLGIALGSSLEVEATDSVGAATPVNVGTLINLDVLGGLFGGGVPSYLKEGSDLANTLDNSSATSGVRIYGYGGDDVLTGGSGNDIIRGGDGNDTILGGAGDDYLNGGAGNDIITGGLGADTVAFDLLINDATGGNDVDTWTDFKLSEGDNIDVSELLSGQNANAHNLEEFVNLEFDRENSTVTLSIDRQGNGDYTELLKLTNQSSAITLEDLLDNKSIWF